MKHAVFLGDPQRIEMVYSPDRRERAAQLSQLYSPVVTRSTMKEHAEALASADVLLSTWGMPLLTEEELNLMPSLQLLLYAAGTVQPFAAPLLNHGVRIVSGWRANAEPVAHFTLGQILLSLKGYFRNVREFTGGDASFRAAHRGPGVCRETVALLGFGAVGRRVRELLMPFELDVLVYDAFLQEETAQQLQVRRVTLEEAFAQARIVSNHLPDKPATEGLLSRHLFQLMGEGAAFLNTGRGRTVNSADLEAVMRQRPDLTALLDVTWPEPMPADSPLRQLPNVLVSSHIAGAVGKETGRMADICLDELERYSSGQPLQHEVTGEMLTALA